MIKTVTMEPINKKEQELGNSAGRELFVSTDADEVMTERMMDDIQVSEEEHENTDQSRG